MGTCSALSCRCPHLFFIQYVSLVSSIKSAINEGIHPKMISKGSSGSYFARAKVDGRIQTVAYVSISFPHHNDFIKPNSVFKPKDEEPYGRLNPKVNSQISSLLKMLKLSSQ
jgi:hypothetical protein